MTAAFAPRLLFAAVLASAAVTSACTAANGSTAGASSSPAAAPIEVNATAAVEQPIARFIRATGSLMAEEHADVAAETAGRVIETPVERGTVVAQGAVLVRVSSSETEARLGEAEANAAQIEARLGLAHGSTAAFDPERVPEVQAASASLALAESEFQRIRSLLEERVVSQSEFDQRRTQVESARQQLESARNAAAQQYQALQAARARVALARKAVADTIVRAPFAGVVAERLVSVGDYVNTGTRVAAVVRVNPLRIQLTVPEQFVAAVAVGQPVTFEVDAYPGRTFTGTVRYVSPALEASQRALTVEALVPNAANELKPGLFATARIQQPERTPAVMVPVDAVYTAAGTSRVYAIVDGHAEERVVTTGQTVDGLMEISSGLKAGEQVATRNVAQLADAAPVR